MHIFQLQSHWSFLVNEEGKMGEVREGYGGIWGSRNMLQGALESWGGRLLTMWPWKNLRETLWMDICTKIEHVCQTHHHDGVQDYNRTSSHPSLILWIFLPCFPQFFFIHATTQHACSFMLFVSLPSLLNLLISWAFCSYPPVVNLDLSKNASREKFSTTTAGKLFMSKRKWFLYEPL